MASLVNENLNIGATPINVYKLLGIHEQLNLMPIDPNIGGGQGICSGQFTAFPVSNAFQNNGLEWRSTYSGQCIVNRAYIGFDFGPIVLDNDNKRLRYGINTEVKQHITSILIQQGCESSTRSTKLRVERSDDSKTWYGVTIIQPKDDNTLQTFNIKQSAPARFWRLVPLQFNGTAKDDFWSVRKLQLAEFILTGVENVQYDFGILENRDRMYANTPVVMKGIYNIQEVQTELSRFGIDTSSSQWSFKVAFQQSTSVLGRPIIIGDIWQLPSETQYDVNMTPVLKYLEVTDVSWSTDGWTPGWQPTIQKVIAQPMLASQETMDIVGDLGLPNTENDFAHLDNKNFNIEALFLDQEIRETANTNVPEKGGDIADVADIPYGLIQLGDQNGVGNNIRKLDVNRMGYGQQDAMPPNGAPYTEGETYPQNPKDGDYHRLIYVGLVDNIPARLYRYSLAKLRWVFMEEDKRARINDSKSLLDSMLNDPNRIPSGKIAK